MAENNRIAVIMGSIREGRMNDRVALWVVRQLKEHGFAPEIVDPGDPELMPLLTGDSRAVARLETRLSDMDGFVIVTPEFNHAAPGPLKTLIDSVKAPWHLRPVGLVSYGGISGGLRATESLRTVFAELHSVALRDTVSFVSPWRRFDEHGRITDSDHADAAEAAMAVFAHRLRWWADMLAEGRARRSYDPEDR